MNFNLYLDERAAKRLDAVARKTRTPRNALIRRAVGAWLDRQEAVWPDEVLKLIPDPDLAPFESHRSELHEPADDPLDSPKHTTSTRLGGVRSPALRRRTRSK